MSNLPKTIRCWGADGRAVIVPFPLPQELWRLVSGDYHVCTSDEWEIFGHPFATTFPASEKKMTNALRVLRFGSPMRRIYEMMSSAHKPMHITEILDAIDLPDTRENRVNISSGISRYARQGRFFVQTGPRIFGIRHE